MDKSRLSIGALEELGEHLCRLYLRDEGQVPGGLWSWKVYVDGNIHSRGPGSTRKSPLKWYATLPKGPHRVVVREWDDTKPDRGESDTIQFIVENQSELVIDVAYRNGKVVLSIPSADFDKDES